MDAESRSNIRHAIDRRTRKEQMPRGIRARATVPTTPNLLVALAGIDDTEREAWVDWHMLGRSNVAISSDMGITLAEVHRLIKAASNNLLPLLQALSTPDHSRPADEIMPKPVRWMPEAA